MNKHVNDLRDRILLSVLPDAPLEGWTWDAVYRAAQTLNIQEDMVHSLFPDGLCDVVAHFSDWADREMLKKLTKIKTDDLRIRDKIQQAVETRLDIQEPHRDALRLAMAYWSVPPRGARASRIVWRTADRIWDWTGDTSTDYNRYTKRGLLSGILTATALVFIKDRSENNEMTRDFLERRIENVLQFGQILGKLKR